MDLCTLLEDYGLLSHAQAETIRAAASRTSDPLVRHLLESRLVPEKEWVRLLALETGCKVVDPRSLRPSPDAVRIVPWDVASRHMVLPLRIRDDEPQSPLEVVLCDPLDPNLVQKLEDLAGSPLVLTIARPSHLSRAIERAYSGLVTRVLRPTDQNPQGPWGTEAARSEPPRVEAMEEQAGPITVPSHSVLDEAGLSIKLSAILDILDEKGLVSRREFAERVRRMLEEGEEPR